MKHSLPVRMALMAAGMYITCTGIALSAVADLGTTPQATLPFVLSEGTSLTLGTWTLAVNMVFLALQLAILRGKMAEMLVLQVPALFLFSVMTDIALWMVRAVIPAGGYLESWVLCLLGVLALSFGTTLTVKADLGFAPADGIVRVISWKRRTEFGRVKLGFDILMVSLAAVCSLLMFAGLQGVRERTVAAMLLIGPLVRRMSSLMGAEHHREIAPTEEVAENGA